MIGPIVYRKKWGFLSEFGEFIIPPCFEQLGECRQDRISFESNGKLGFLNSRGEVAIPAKFQGERFEMPHFSDGVCAVRFNEAVGYIYENGEWAIAPQFERGWDRRHGMALVETKGTDAHYRIIDPAGQPLSVLNEYSIRGLQDWPENWELFPVFVDRAGMTLTRFINWRGQVVFPERYPWMTDFYAGVAGFCPNEDRVDHPFGLVRLSGEVICAPAFYAMRDFQEGLARAGRTPKEFGFLNPEGHWVIEPQYRQALPFSDGLACVTVKGKKGFINTIGEVVIDPRFDQEASFKAGFAQVKYEGKQAVIDKTGRILWEAKLED